MSAATTFGALALGARFRVMPAGGIYRKVGITRDDGDLPVAAEPGEIDDGYAIHDDRRVYPVSDAEYLEHLRGEIRAERISWGELADLQDMAELIDPGDVELLEWAGVPEFPEERAAFFAERARERGDLTDHGDPEHAADGLCVDCTPDPAPCRWCGAAVVPVTGGEYPEGRPLATTAENDPYCPVADLGRHETEETRP